MRRAWALTVGTELHVCWVLNGWVGRGPGFFKFVLGGDMGGRPRNFMLQGARGSGDGVTPS